MSNAEPRKTVFVSYRRADVSERALHDVLSVTGPYGFDAYRDLEINENWSSRLQRELQRSHALLLLMGRDWLRTSDEYGRRLLDSSDDHVRREIQFARELGINIIPVLLDGAKMPPAMALPEDLQFLATSKFIRQTDNNDWMRKLHGVLEGSRDGPLDSKYRVNAQDYEILRFELENFKCFETFSVELDKASVLTGNWSCIAGINGAGKTTVLQALALLLMGPRKVREIGGKRLDAFRRRDRSGDAKIALLRAEIRAFNRIFPIEMTIGPNGADSFGAEFWSLNEDALFVGYGAGRNVSAASLHGRDSELSSSVERFISLFDPMARLYSAEGVFSGRSSKNEKSLALRVFLQLVQHIFPEEIMPRTDGDFGNIEFQSGSALHDVWDLPDGYRSSVAWLADLAVRISEQNQSERPESISDIGGIVLIDEIELHLHASLQRSIVSRLREALPGLQWIVTTHSPLVLSSFDRNELLALDDDFSSGLKKIDRHILGLTADQVYQYLFDTPASSEAAEKHLASFSDDQIGPDELDAILNDETENYGVDRFRKIQDRLRKLRN